MPRKTAGPRLSELAGSAATVACIWAAGVAAGFGRPPSEVALWLAAAFLPYGWTLATEQAPLRRALALGTTAGLPLLALDPALSDDLYRYLWDGRVLRSGLDPYAWAPDDPALAPLRDEWWPRINNPEVPTIYPPIAQGLFAAAGAVAHAPWTFKLLAFVAHLATTPLVARLSGAHAPRAVLGWALNPLAVSASALDGHIDAVLAFALAATVLALVRGRVWLAALLAGVASGVKLVGILLAPLVSGRRLATVAAAVLVLLPLMPLLTAGHGSGTTGGLGQYARRWQGNAGLFEVLEGGAALGLSVFARTDGSSPDRVQLNFARPLLEAAQGTAWDPRAGVRPEKKEVADLATFPTDYLASLLARTLALALVVTLALALARRRVEPLVAARWIVLAALLLSPQIHPWYLVWLLPLELASGRTAGLAWSAAVLVAYAPLDGWIAARRWHEPPLARLLEHALVLALIAWEELLRARPYRPVAVWARSR